MSHTLRSAYDMPRIYLYRNPVDFRKSFRGLAAIVEQELGHNPFDGGFYAFTNRWLLDGYDISRMQGHKKLHYEALF